MHVIVFLFTYILYKIIIFCRIFVLVEIEIYQGVVSKMENKDTLVCQNCNKQYKSIFKNSPDGIYRSTPDGEYIDVNPTLVKMLGYDSKEELLQINIPDDLYYKQSDRPPADERNKIFVTRFRRKDNTLIWAEVNSWAIYDNNSDVKYYEGIIRNITETKKREMELYTTREKLKYTLSSIAEGVIVTDEKGYISMMNSRAEHLTGYDQKEAEGKLLDNIFHIINEYSQQPVENPVGKVLKTGVVEGLANHTVLIAKDGTRRPIADSASPIKDNKGNVLGVILIFRDVTEKRKMIKRLERSRNKYMSIFENTGTGMAIVAEDTTFMIINKKMEEISGYSKEEMEGKIVLKDIVADKEEYQRMIKYHKRRRNTKLAATVPHHYEFKMCDKQGKIKDIMVTVDIIPDTSQSIASFIDITTRKKIEDKIRYQGYHDDLTGLYNWAYFKESLERLDSKRQLPLSIIMGDVNGLKLVNDAFGHNKGDQLLKNIAKLIKKSCRKEDIVARWGGDEFVILLPRTHSRTANEVVDRIKVACKSEDDRLIKTSVSLGFVTKETADQDIWELLKKAESWMYKHKLTESQSARSSIISSLEETLWERDYETKEHACRLKDLAKKVGKKIGLPGNKIDELILLAGLHDIGKIAIPDSILMKPGPFNEEEWETMKKHSEIGYRIANSSLELASIADGILHHHEWWDGNGYPHQLKGEEIPIISRIISVVDAYDVMTHERPYKKAMEKNKAISELKKYAGHQFDPEIVEIFIGLI